MKDGQTHLAHKAEHAVDMDTGAILAVTLHGGVAADSHSLPETLAQAAQNLPETLEADDLLEEVVADKGYHSNGLLNTMAELEIRSYVSEPQRGRRGAGGVTSRQATNGYDTNHNITSLRVCGEDPAEFLERRVDYDAHNLPVRSALGYREAATQMVNEITWDAAYRSVTWDGRGHVSTSDKWLRHQPQHHQPACLRGRSGGIPRAPGGLRCP